MNPAIFCNFKKSSEMKKLTLTLIILSLGLSVNAQNSRDIYRNTYGISEVTPSKTIRPNTLGRYDVYNTNQGFPEITPHKTIKPKDW